MKRIKPLYVYLLLVFSIVVIFYFLSFNNSAGLTSEGSASVLPDVNINGRQMPEDSIHKGLENPLSPKPNKNNVMPEIVKHMNELKKDLDANPGDTSNIREYADFLASAHQSEKALQYYGKILNIDPARIDILNSMVYLYYSNKNYDTAEKYLKKIISIDKNNEDAMYNLGAIYANEGKKDKARQSWENLMRLYPNSSMAQKAGESLNRL